ncbi:Erythritol/L-threitol-binding protein [Microbacterium lemovicicum]|uniref:Erythritol/L-threitol-binding protein n=1 Tax=Microbacterium lemovicicum TaxID=1072463 RepID=A0A3Q9J2Q5_9MICO|nr:sugar ABC transporter substrate-binding protein [Microbacterium lemovicicum]AZS38612.1 Erythritol/L-threitol-binding protein [Microbacterium lemovicicum]
MSAQRRSSSPIRPSRRILTSLAIAAVGGLALAGCAGGSGGSDGASGGGAATSLKVLIAAPQEGAGKILEADFEAQTGTQIEVEVVPYDQIQTKAILDAQSGTNNYDVIQYWYTSVGALADAGALEDITSWVDGDADIDSSDFIQSIFGPYTQYDGKTYGLPIDGDTHVLFYNKEIFERNGVEVPTTWSEYEQVAQKITDAEKANGVYGSAILGAKSAFNIGSTFFNRLATMSPDPIDSQMPQLNTQAAVDAAQSMLDAAPYALPSPLEIGFEQALPQFLSGNVGMIEFWTDLGVFAQDPGQSKIVDKWGVAPLPVGPEGKISGALNAGWAMGISPNAPDQELAQQFVAFASSKEMNEKLITTTGSGVDPIRTSTLESDKYTSFAPDVSAVAAQVLPNAQSWPTSPQAPEMIQTLSDNLALMLQGSLTAEQAMSQTWDAWQSLG